MIQIVLQLQLGNALPLFHHFVEGVVAAEFQHHVHIFAVFKDVVKLHDVSMRKGFVNLDFSNKLNELVVTFCLAFDFLRVYLSTILMAAFFLFSKFYIWYTLANPPFPRNFFLAYRRTTVLLALVLRSSMTSNSLSSVDISLLLYIFLLFQYI